MSAFTGLSIEEFNRLYPMIADRYEDYEKKRLSREGKKKDIEQERKFKLDLIDHLRVDQFQGDDVFRI